MRILILGASYGSLLSTKLLMAGHDVSLVCRAETASLINKEGTFVRIKLRDEETHRSFYSGDFTGKVDATTPTEAKPEEYDMIALAMQEPQYSSAEVEGLLKRVAKSGKPCLSIMNMPPLPYLRRIPQLQNIDLASCYDKASLWADFTPEQMTLCSPDPQAFRPPEEAKNILHVGLPTNFKAAAFADPKHNAMLKQLESDISEVSVDGKDVPVKLRVYESLFVPMAKWSMLLAGNYSCVLENEVRSIRDAVHGDLEASRAIYAWVDSLAQKIGASPDDMVVFDKYAGAAESLQKPSSVARAIDAGAQQIERVDRLVQAIGRSLGMQNDEVDAIVKRVDARLEANRKTVPLSCAS